MSLTEYQPLALRTEKPLPRVIDRLYHAALGIDTETGELNSVVKGVTIYGKKLDDIFDKVKQRTYRECAMEEIADACWYIAIGCDALQAQMDTLAPLHTTLVFRIDDLALNLATYSGKIADIVLFSKSRGHAALNPHDRNFVLNSMANLLRVLYGVCAALDLDMDLLLGANIAKLRKRFPDAYSDDAATERADKDGVDARNS